MLRLAVPVEDISKAHGGYPRDTGGCICGAHPGKDPTYLMPSNAAEIQQQRTAVTECPGDTVFASFL